LDFVKFQTKTLLLDIRHYTECQNKILDPALILSVLNSIEPLKSVKQNVFVLLSNEDWLKDFSDQGYKVLFSANTYDEYLSINTNLTEGVIIKNKGISKDQVSKLHSLNKKVLIFDIRAPKETRLAMKKDPDAIVTDDLRTAIIEKR